MTLYTVTSQEGADRYGSEVGTAVDLDIDDGEALAVVAAGWLTPGGKVQKAKESEG